MADSVSVSVVLPAYNEESTIRNAVENTLATLSNFLSKGQYEIIIAEDGCTDNTSIISSELARSHEEVRHYTSPSRLGRGTAITHAFEIAKGTTLVYIDSDLATDNKHLEELITIVSSGSAHIATGSRWFPGTKTERPLHRSLLSKGFNSLVRLLLKSNLYDHQCGFKAFDKEIFLILSPDMRNTHWFWDTEILIRAQNSNFKIAEFPVSWTPQRDTKVDIFRDVFAMSLSILRLWWELFISPLITPLNSSIFGFFISALALILMGSYLDLDPLFFYIFLSNPVFLIASVIVYLLSWPIRGLRYKEIISQLGFSVSLGFLTKSIFISQTCNLIIPARMGDAARAYILKTKKQIPYVSGFASLVFERLFDLLTITILATVVFVTTLILNGQESLFFLTNSAGQATYSGKIAFQLAVVIGFITIFLFSLLFFTSKKESHRISNLIKLFSNDLYAQRFSSLLETFIMRIQQLVSNPKVTVRIGIFSILIWSLDVIVAIIILFSFKPNIPLNTIIFACFFAVSIGNLSKVLPLSSGGIGLYEGAFTLLMVNLTGISPDLALGIAIIDHAIKNIVTIAGGTISIFDLNISLGKTLQRR